MDVIEGTALNSGTGIASAEAIVSPRRIAPEPQSTALTPMDMLSRAVSQGANIDMIEKLMSLHERWEANQARKAFDAAIAAAKAEIPVIQKNREVDFTSAKGRTNYRHEDLGEIARTVDPVLARHGLAYRFRVSSEPNEPVTVTCVVSHRDGHFEETTLRGGRDDSGNKNAIQQIGSTISYLQRYTLKSALGLAASKDDDGHASGGDFGDTISAEQVHELLEIAAEVGANVEKFAAYLKVRSLPDLPVKRFDEAKRALEAKRTGGVNGRS